MLATGAKAKVMAQLHLGKCGYQRSARDAGIEGSDEFAGDTFPAPLAPVDTEGSISFCHCRRRWPGIVDSVAQLIMRSVPGRLVDFAGVSAHLPGFRVLAVDV
eukprot:scaffold28205_cov85-Cyclotella_meneghiniana.AAC.1